MARAKIIIGGLCYDPETGVFTWLVAKSNSVKPGSVAGSINSSGHRQIRWEGRQLPAHRLAWRFVNGRWPAKQIDHINGIRDDNRIDNLREATQSQNCANRRVMRNGLKGACWFGPLQAWKASICKDGRKIHLGYHASEEEAHQAYIRAAQSIHGAFARAE